MNMTHQNSLTLTAMLACLLAPAALTPAELTGASGGWRDDPIWYDGKAEWALYEAERTIYGETRRYQTTIFVNK